MMLPEDIRAYCLSKPLAQETYPFGEIPICYKRNYAISSISPTKPCWSASRKKHRENYWKIPERRQC